MLLISKSELATSKSVLVIFNYPIVNVFEACVESLSVTFTTVFGGILKISSKLINKFFYRSKFRTLPQTMCNFSLN